MPVIVLVADGARPDTLAAAMDDGALPHLARLRAEGGQHVVASTFPSVTGPAYAPFLLGRFPGPIGLPGLRWFDRSRRAVGFPGHARSYVGAEMRRVNRDLDPTAPTLFELAGSSLAALSVIERGLPRRRRVGRGLGFVARAAHTHFRGDVRGWLRLDRDIADTVVRRTLRDRPDFVFCALTGTDKTSHAAGHDAPEVREAMAIVDETAGALRHGLEKAGAWERTHLWVVSDHGHSPVRHHEDLAGLLREWGHRVMAHPWIVAPGRDIAVMVSGNAMAHLYLELDQRERPWWPALAGRWEPLAAALLDRPAVDLLLLPHAPGRCEVRARGRGRALVEWDGASRYAYRPLDGDPLGLGAELPALGGREAFDRCLGTDYPDAVVQIAHLAGASRAGEVIISAARDWDLRSRWEPIPHRSTHGALYREHMLVPLVTNHPPARAPRRTTDLMPGACHALGIAVPERVDGESFL